MMRESLVQAERAKISHVSNKNGDRRRPSNNLGSNNAISLGLKVASIQEEVSESDEQEPELDHKYFQAFEDLTFDGLAFCIFKVQ